MGKSSENIRGLVESIQDGIVSADEAVLEIEGLIAQAVQQALHDNAMDQR